MNSAAVPVLAATGSAPLVLVVTALVLLGVGVAAVMVSRSRSRSEFPDTGRLGAGALLVLVLSAGMLGTAPQARAAGESCALLDVGVARDGDGVQVWAGSAQVLVPSTELVTALSYAITNPTAFPVWVSVGSTVTDDAAGIAELIAAEVQIGSAAQATGSLAKVANTDAILLEPGQTQQVSYRLKLVPEAGNEAQNRSVLFNSVITIRQA